MEPFLASVLVAATPFLFAATGELVAERSGVLNLGVEGMMLMGAVAAFAISFETGSTVLAAAAGAAAGLLMAAIFSLIALTLMANQAATGLALTIFGIGASGLIGQPYIGQPLTPPPGLSLPGSRRRPPRGASCSAETPSSIWRSRSPVRSPGSSPAPARG